MNFRKPYDDDIVKMASGFPVGMGKPDAYGVVSGGQMALGMVYGRTMKSQWMKMLERAMEIMII